MIVKIFKSNNPLVAALIPVLVAVFWFTAYLTGSYDEGIEYTDFGLDLFIALRSFFDQQPLLEVLLGIALVSFQAIYLNRIFNKNEFYEKNIFLPSMIYAVLMSSAPGIHFVSPLLLANTFVIFALSFMYKMKRQDDAKNDAFMTSFMLGVASCLYPPYILLVLIPFIALLIIRPFVFREYLLTLIGFVLPWVYFIVFTILAKESIYIQVFQLGVNEELDLSYFKRHLALKIALIAVLFFILLQGFVQWRAALNLSGLRFKRLNQLNTYFFMLGFALAVTEILISQIKFNVLVLAIPLTLILPFGVTEGKNSFFSTFLWNALIVIALFNIIFI